MTEILIRMKFLRAKCKWTILNEKQIIKFLTTAAVQKLKPPDIFKGTSQHTPQSPSYPKTPQGLQKVACCNSGSQLKLKTGKLLSQIMF